MARRPRRPQIGDLGDNGGARAELDTPMRRLFGESLGRLDRGCAMGWRRLSAGVGLDHGLQTERIVIRILFFVLGEHGEHARRVDEVEQPREGPLQDEHRGHGRLDRLAALAVGGRAGHEQVGGHRQGAFEHVAGRIRVRGHAAAPGAQLEVEEHERAGCRGAGPVQGRGGEQRADTDGAGSCASRKHATPGIDGARGRRERSVRQGAPHDLARAPRECALGPLPERGCDDLRRRLDQRGNPGGRAQLGGGRATHRRHPLRVLRRQVVVGHRLRELGLLLGLLRARLPGLGVQRLLEVHVDRVGIAVAAVVHALLLGLLGLSHRQAGATAAITAGRARARADHRRDGLVAELVLAPVALRFFGLDFDLFFLFLVGGGGLFARVVRIVAASHVATPRELRCVRLHSDTVYHLPDGQRARERCMDSIAGMTPTGRRISGPASDLIELNAESGLKHTAIQFNEAFWDHAGITSSLTVVLGFLESPMVTGLVELVERDRDSGTFVYPTGSVWSVAEVIRTMANAGRIPGIRAGLELCYVAGQVLMEAGESGPAQGIYSHGGLTPWRLMLKADGQVQLIGYGLPQVEVLQYLDDPSVMPREDSFRYCPPERLEGQGEDVTSDLFALALIGLEMMTGKPVYDGLVDDILQKATRAEGAYTLYKWRDRLPDSVREVLGKAIKYDPDTRYQDPNDFVHDVHDILSSVDADGPSLMEVMETVRRAPKRGRALMGGQTAAISKEQLKRMAEELDEVGGRGVAAPSRPRAEGAPEEDDNQPRWGKVARRGRRGEEEEEAPPPTRSSGTVRGRRSGADDSPRDRLRRSRGGEEEESGRSRLRRSRGNEEEDQSSARDRLRRGRGGEDDARSRLRRGRDEDEDSGGGRLRRSRGEEQPAAEDPRARLRRSRGGEEEPAAPARPER
ncbi:MAG: hypothetical protein EP330_07720, partial [Deltaproteobacteria bacterium]